VSQSKQLALLWRFCRDRKTLQNKAIVFSVFSDKLVGAKCSNLKPYKNSNMNQNATECLPIAIKRLPVNVNKEQYELLTQIAGQEKRSLSGQLAKILDDWLQQYQRDRTNTKGEKSQ